MVGLIGKPRNETDEEGAKSRQYKGRGAPTPQFLIYGSRWVWYGEAVKKDRNNRRVKVGSLKVDNGKW